MKLNRNSKGPTDSFREEYSKALGTLVMLVGAAAEGRRGGTPEALVERGFEAGKKLIDQGQERIAKLAEGKQGSISWADACEIMLCTLKPLIDELEKP